MHAAEKTRLRVFAIATLMAALSILIFAQAALAEDSGGLTGVETAPPAAVPFAPATDIQPAAGSVDQGALSPIKGPKLKIVNGLATIPAGVAVPAQVVQIINDANAIAYNGYNYGSCHKSLTIQLSEPCDCSGSGSQALKSLLGRAGPLDSRAFASWDGADPGYGAFVTYFTKPSHFYLQVSNLRFDTSARKEHNAFYRADLDGGSRWTTKKRSGSSYQVLHPRFPGN